MFRRFARCFCLVMVLLVAMPVLAASASSIRSMHYFVGHWGCSGRFPSSGRHIASRIDFEPGLQGRVLIKHHADRAPSTYRALEDWGYSPRTRRFRATVIDSGGGTRLMTSDGWHGDMLTWEVTDPAQPKQAFVYVRQGANRFRLDWKVLRSGAHTMAVGDTLSCRRLSMPN